MSFQIFTSEQVTSIRKSGAILRACLKEVASHVRPGVTTKELDRIAEDFIRSRGGVPTFKGYRGYPATLCISANDEVVHGIPGDRVLQEGDVVSLDGGVTYEGLITDACITVPVGDVPDDVRQFLDATEQALHRAVSMLRAGVRVGDISSAIQHFVEDAGYHCIPSLTGHGLGTQLHQFPDIPNVGQRGEGPIIPAGTLLAIEPITAMGAAQVYEADDGWTIKTRDGSIGAHFEHTVLVGEKGCEVMA